jgi:protein TonB
MFEQSIVVAQPANKPWTLGVSILAQISLVSAAILFPLVYSEILPGFSMLGQSIEAPPPRVAPQPIQQTQRSVTQSTVTEPRVFREPPRTPPTVDMRPDAPSIEPSEAVIGGIGDPVGVNSLNRILSQAPVLPRPDTPVHDIVKPYAEVSAPVRVSGPVQEAKLLRKVVPIYPQLAIQTRTQGTVHLVGVISKDGTIRNLQVIDGPPLLIRAALDAVKQWVYRPTLLGQEPVEVVAPITVTFILNR